jgi:Zn-dependent metalloprotease
MTPSHKRHAGKSHKLRLAVALALASMAGLAGAADNAAAFKRAVAHIEAFPGRTLHAAGNSYVSRDVMVDADGSEHVRVARLYKGLRVIGGDMVVHSSRSGAFVDVSRSLNQAVTLDVRARLGGAEALRAVLSQRSGTPEGAPQLVVYARGERPLLAYDVFLLGTQADGTPSEEHVIVDASTGALLDAYNDIHTVPKTGTGNTLFSGAVPLSTDRRFANIGKYSLKDTTRGGQYTTDLNNGTSGIGTTFTDKDNTWGNGATSDRATAGADAHYGVTLTWDYYLNVHGRNGIANDGKGAYSRVHYSTNYANAFWSDSCFCMTYGDGNAQWWPLVSIDIAGHEMSHGVTSRTAGLIYSGESGGLNEGTSDIFGTMVEFYANNANDVPDYLIGEEIYKSGGSLRSMIKPSVDGASADCWYSGVGGIDVHYSSGIANHFFFLLAEGTTGGSPSPTCTAANTRVASGTGSVTGIGRSAAEKIWYRALTVYMTSGTTYAQARLHTLSAATDLYGTGSAEYNAVNAAWAAVKVL